MIELELARALGLPGALELDQVEGLVVARCGALEGQGTSEADARRALFVALVQAVADEHRELAASRPRPAVAPPLNAAEGPSWRAVPVEAPEILPGTPLLVPITPSSPIEPHRLVLEQPECWYVLRIDHDGRSCLRAPGPIDGTAFADAAADTDLVAWPAALRPDGPPLLLYIANRTPQVRALRASLWGLGAAIPATTTPAPTTFEELLAATESG